ncbi:MAG: type 2 isopentenyl-diphosphate Delta-isomerase [Candidatus Dormibacteraeota bacterium]|nr:type 2 isopentenyl-diphosphate Delta-isomerase [Candidatus Dormibacteraeota bacterium]
MSQTAIGSAVGGPLTQTSARKADHIRINLEEDVDAKGIDPGFGAYRFVHSALPEIDLEEVRLTASFLGHGLSAPVLISCMTGGTDRARQLNRHLAAAAEQHGMAMGVGSCRALLERPDLLPTFEVRSVAPHILLLANLGAVQLNRGVSADDCRRIVGMLQADALVLHCNPLQEALQPEGDTCFAGLLPRIEALCRDLEFPVVVKEVGWGIDAALVRRLLDLGVSAVDVAGAGGTSWSEVERHRMSDQRRAEVASAFAGWGIPTAVAITDARAAAPEAELVASGGVRNGVDVATAIALGANVVGVAGPLLRAADRGAAELSDSIDVTLEQLRLAMFCIGARTVDELRGTRRLVAKGPAA